VRRQPPRRCAAARTPPLRAIAGSSRAQRHQVPHGRRQRGLGRAGPSCRRDRPDNLPNQQVGLTCRTVLPAPMFRPS
jgi:hypothetical protein